MGLVQKSILVCNYISSFLTFISLVLREATFKIDAITSDKFSSTLIFGRMRLCQFYV